MSSKTGTISGGTELKKRLDALAKKLDKKQVLRAGFLAGATYPDGTSVPMVAAIHEFGAPKVGIPPRSYFRPTVAAKASQWGDIIAAQLAAADYDVAVVLGRVGEVIRAELQQAITEMNSPPLSRVTLMLRKMKSENPDLVVSGRVVGEAARRVAEGEEIGAVNSKPLQDTGFMKSRVDYEVAG